MRLWCYAGRDHGQPDVGFNRRHAALELQTSFAKSFSKRDFSVKRFSAACNLISFLFCFLLTTAVAESPRRVIIDTDPGVDDAMAILLALNSPELRVEALTVVPGNVDGRQGLENALKLVSLAGRCDVIVAGGAEHPLNQKMIAAQF